MPRPMTPGFARYLALDRLLVAHGWPATSPWWLEQVERYFASPQREYVFRVGRRGGKSSTLCRVGVVEILSDRHEVPPGDMGMLAVISTGHQDATKRLTTILAILDVLREPYRPLRVGNGVRLVRRRMGVQVFTASIAGVSGFTGVFVFCDEVAKWREKDTGVNPATEVLRSVRPTLAGMPHARIVLSSSPMGRLDAHAKAFEEGDTVTQLTAFAPTWVARPDLTEADTRAFVNPWNEDEWLREYGAVPLEQSEHGLFSSALLTRAERADAADIGVEEGCRYVADMDPANRGDAWTFAIGTKRRVGGKVRRSIVCTREWHGTDAAPLDTHAVLEEILVCLQAYRVNDHTREGILPTLYTDQAGADAIASIARRLHIPIVIEAATQANKLERYTSMATGLAVDDIELPKLPQMRADLLLVTKRLTPNGFTIDLPRRGGRHADWAPTVSRLLSRSLPDPPEPIKEDWTHEEIVAADVAAMRERSKRQRDKMERERQAADAEQARQRREGEPAWGQTGTDDSEWFGS